MSRNFNNEGHFVCKCGREFTKEQSYHAHQSHCKIHLDSVGKPSHESHYIEDSRRRQGWNRGLTKDNNESIRRQASAMRAYIKSLREDNPLIQFNKNKGSEVYKKQAETRKRKYESGELTPAPGVGRGKYSYLSYKGKKILLRSTYELIYALYLLYQNIEFDYESVRSTYEGRTYISDFLVNNKVIEIKGNYHANTTKSRIAFESAGYQYEVLYWKDLQFIYDYLKSIIDIDKILLLVKEGHNSRNYYTVKFEDLSQE